MKKNTKILTLVFVVAFLILLIGCLPGLTPPTPKGVINGRIMVPSPETAKDITGWIPIANATVTLIDSEGVTHTVTTDEDGYYTFTDIAVNANTIITATATIDGNTVIIKDIIPQAVAADEDYDAKTADAESTALALIVEELLEQGLDPKDVNLEEIQDSDNFTEVVGQVTSVLEENGNVTTDPGVTNIVDYVAGDIINPPAYTPPEEIPEPEPEPGPEPGPEPVILTHIVVPPVEMTLFVGEFKVITSVTAHYSDGSYADIVLGNCTYTSSAVGIAKVSDAGVVTAVTAGTATITVSYGGKTDTLEVTVGSILLTSIVVLPETMTLFEGEFGDIKSVTAHYNNGSIADITIEDCTYLSSDTDVATVSNVGLVSAKVIGEATITVGYTEEEITKTVHIEETDTVEVKVIGKVHNIDADKYYNTIQDAVSEASPDDTITVAAGTYNEYVDINKALTLQGEDRETTEIKFGYGDYPSEPPLTILADGVTVSGFTIHSGPEIEPAWTIAVEGDSALFTDLNVIKEPLLPRGRDGSAFWLAPGLEGFTFTDSTIDSDWNGIYALEDSSDITVRNVDFTYPGEWGILLKLITGATIEGNTFTCTGHDDISVDSQGIVISRGSTAIEIRENQFIGSYPVGARSHIGILLQEFKSGPVGVSILDNDISDFDTGIKIEENVATSGISIHDNDIYDNFSYGVNNLGLDTVDAINNWWGAESGPYHPTANSGGLGNPVSDNVDF